MTHKACQPFMHARWRSGFVRTASGSAVTTLLGVCLTTGSSQTTREKVPACRKKSRNRAMDSDAPRYGSPCEAASDHPNARSSTVRSVAGTACESTALAEEVKKKRAKRHNGRSDRQMGRWAVEAKAAPTRDRLYRPSAHPPAYCTAFTMSKIGKYIATTMP